MKSVRWDGTEILRENAEERDAIVLRLIVAGTRLQRDAAQTMLKRVVDLVEGRINFRSALEWEYALHMACIEARRMMLW